MARTSPPKQRVAFSLLAPDAQAVALAGDFTGWEQQPAPLKKLKSGVWKTTIALPPGSHQYRFLVDGQWHDDPECPARVPNSFGTENCVRVVA